MSVTRCKLCRERTHIEWLTTTFGKRLPFEYELVNPEELHEGEQGWVVVRKNGRALVAPMEHVGRQTAAGIRRVLVVHACEAYLQTKRAS